MTMAQQLTLFDPPPAIPETEGPWEARVRRLYAADGQPIPDHLRPVLAVIHIQEAELTNPDPLTVRVPVAGSQVEVAIKGYAHLGWLRATVTRIGYPADPIMTVQLEDSRGLQSLFVSRRDWSRNPNIEKGPLWRWPGSG